MPNYQDVPCPRQTEGCLGLIPANMSYCPTCGTQVSAPNVRAAEQPEERAALEMRYETAVMKAIANGVENELKELERILESSKPVVNVTTSYLEQMLSSNNTLYATYQEQVKAGTRKPAFWPNDRKRIGVEGFLFGSIGSAITYAALSPNSAGLWSYGELTLTLRLVAIAHRATLMEVNSYDFFDAHASEIVNGNTPMGYISRWEDRVKLGVAKLADQLWIGMDVKDLNALVLSSSGDRSLDNFVEIHIFGSFDNRAIELVVSQGLPKDRPSRLLLAALKEKASRLGIDISHV